MPKYRHRVSGTLADVDPGDTAAYDNDPQWVNLDPQPKPRLITKAKPEPEPDPEAA